MVSPVTVGLRDLRLYECLFVSALVVALASALGLLDVLSAYLVTSHGVLLLWVDFGQN
jgi:hypothetical protein